MLSLLNKALLVQSTISTLAFASRSKSQFGAREYIVEPSAAYQIYESDPDLTNVLGSDGSNSDTSSAISNAVSSALTSTTIASAPTSFSPLTSSTLTSSILTSSALTSSTLNSISSNITVVTPTSFSTMTSVPSNSTVAAPTATVDTVPHDDNDTIPFDGIYGNETYINGNGTRARRLTSRSAQLPFAFIVSQGANGANQTELVVAFNNLPCPPASYGPYSFEFNFVPEAAYNSIGNNQINMFRLPAQLPVNPTFNNIQPLKGSLIGTFELPTGAGANSPKLIFINQLSCVRSINLLFEIADTSPEAGSVIYINRDGMGLRERSGT